MSKYNTVFIQPDNIDATIWKFLDFTKFLSLLETRSLYFARSDMLPDPHEGIYGKFGKIHRPVIGSAIDPGRQRLYDNYKKIRESVFLNCWHENEHESAAMWDLYLKSNEGIAIRSTFGKLIGCFENDHRPAVHIGRVRYLDYQKEKLPDDNELYPFMYKRKSFAHENEIRALIYDEKEAEKSGIFIPVDVTRLIEKIYVAPTAEDWIHDLVVSLTKKYDLDTEVIKSRLFDDPVF